MASKARYTAEVRYSAQTGALVGEVRRAAREQIAAIRGVEDAVKTQTTGWRGLGNELVRLQAGIQVARQAYTALRGVIVDTVGSALEERRGIVALDRALRAHGYTYAQLHDQIETVVASQQHLTRYGDTETRATLAAVAQATRGLALDYGTLERATLLIQDAQEATGRSSQELAEAVGRAIGGQGRGLATILPQYRDLLNHIGQLHDRGERVTRVMDLLTEAYGGQAQQIDDVDRGIAEATNTWGDFKEAIGDTVIEALRTSGALDEITGGIQDMIAWVTQHGDVVRGWLSDLGTLAQAAVTTMQAAVLLLDRLRVGHALPAELPLPNAGPSAADLNAFVNQFYPGTVATPNPTAPVGPAMVLSDEALGGGSGRGRGTQRRGRSPFGGFEAAEQALADLREQALGRFSDWLDARRELYQQALQATREFYDAEAEAANSQAAKLRQYREQELASQRDNTSTQRDQRAQGLAAFQSYAGSAASIYHTIAGNARAYAGVMAGIAAVEAIWRAVIGDFAGAAGATAAAIGYAAQARSGGFGSSRGGSGGTRIGIEPAAPTSLLGRPDNGGRTVNIQLVFQGPTLAADEHRLRRWVRDAVDEADRRGE